MEREIILHVQMFGNFQMSYGEKPLTGEKARDTYFTSLMQILLHHVQSGVSRDRLEEVLLGDRDVENRHQALQTIIYKAKRKLKNMGLPQKNYIELKNGVYYWTSDIPVSEDAESSTGCTRKRHRRKERKRNSGCTWRHATHIRENSCRITQA